jgi:ferrous iron transport protein A
LNLLSEMAVGQHGQVREVQGTDGVSLRLMEMGLTPGVRFRMIGKAPLGDPLELEVRGYRLSVRKNEAARVTVEPAAPAEHR